jgi:hypothetical protein
MSHPVAGPNIRVRFERQLALNGIPEADWAAEWRRELSSLLTPSSYLSGKVEVICCHLSAECRGTDSSPLVLPASCLPVACQWQCLFATLCHSVGR